MWTEGLKSAVFKSGSKLSTGNYRGITILPIFEKSFEIIVYHRLSFANEAFAKEDRYNGGFLPGYRTSDNLFILQGLIQRQLCIGSNLIVCFVDFAKAFDLINRHILFYKIMKGGWHGPVIDTLRNLYGKTSFRVKSKGRVSSIILIKLGVNQGGVASGLLFRKYMCDLESYLSISHGVCLNGEIIAHLLWADDLVLLSDTFHGLQTQLDGLNKFCHNNHMIVNEMKTKFMVFGNPEMSKLRFNSVDIAEVNDYKYLGNIISPTRYPGQDPFRNTYQFLCDQARKATFAMKSKVQAIGDIPPDILLNLFDLMIKPILTYGSDVWGSRMVNWGLHDKFFLHFVRCIMHVKATTRNIITIGECGKFPPSTYCHISTLCYINRLYHMSDEKIAKKVYNDLISFHHQGFNTWATGAMELLDDLKLDITMNTKSFALNCKRAVQTKFVAVWNNMLQDSLTNPILRTYKVFKSDFNIEPYLCLVNKPRYRQAIAKLRCSSHILEIERGRHTNPKTPVAERLCCICHEIEDEKHFVLHCSINAREREDFYTKIDQTDDDFRLLDDEEKFVYILKNTNKNCLTWLGEFLYRSFLKRNQSSFSR